MNSIISCKNISRSFTDGTGACLGLAPFSAELVSGQLVGITGPSGSGKSTLLQILGTLDTAYEGSACLNGHELRTFNDEARAKLRRSTVSMAFQTPHLFPHLTIKENLEFSQSIACFERAPPRSNEALIERLKLTSLLASRPNALSGGERRRVGLVRSLLTDAAVLLLDEPGVHLDPKLHIELFNILREERDRGRLVIFTSHSELALREADHCYTLGVASS